MMAAIRAARCGADVTLFERGDRLGKKLRITGKGRCNLTNDCERDEFLSNVPTNPRFIYAALNNFSVADTKDFFEGLGVPLKTERDKRVFPVSDKAADVADALVRHLRECGCKVINKRVKNLLISDGCVRGLALAGGEEYAFDAVIVCTGGLSYPLTGSDGDGYKFAREAGHVIVSPTPSLVPLETEGKLCAAMQGLSLKNVSLKIVDAENGKSIFEDFGEMMFTHFGITGPIVLSASSHMPKTEKGRYRAIIDLKSALDEKELDRRILSDFSKYANRDFVNSLSDLLPQKMIVPIVELSGIDGRKKVNLVTKDERKKLVHLLKNLCIDIKGFRPISEAIITSGGVDVKEINPKTMESKLVCGLYFAGEVIDVDAYTGGFNLQIAFSTGVLAGMSAAR